MAPFAILLVQILVATTIHLVVVGVFLASGLLLVKHRPGNASYLLVVGSAIQILASLIGIVGHPLLANRIGLTMVMTGQLSMVASTVGALGALVYAFSLFLVVREIVRAKK